MWMQNSSIHCNQFVTIPHPSLKHLPICTAYIYYFGLFSTTPSMKKNILLCLGLMLALAMSAAAQQGSSRIEVTDLTRIKQLGGIALSHDGNKVAFTVTAIVSDKKNSKEYTYLTQIWITATDGQSKPYLLTDSAGSQPAWSKDDQSIVYVSLVKGKGQLFLAPSAGGTKPVQLTNARYGASQPQWSPDGKQLLFTTLLSLRELEKDSLFNPSHRLPAWASEKPGFRQVPAASNTKPNPDGDMAAIRSYLAQNETDRKAKVFNRLNFEGEAATEPEFFFTEYMVTDAVSGAQARPVTRGFAGYSNARFMPDGKTILLTATDSTINPDRVTQSAIYTVPVAGGALQHLLHVPGRMLSNASVSPSGRYMVYTSGKSMDIDVPEVHIYDAQQPAKVLTIPVDRSAGNFAWSADGQYLYFTAQSNGGIPIYRVSLTNLKPEQLSSFDAGMSGLDIGADKLVYVKTEVANPYELYTSDLNNKASQRITEFNYSWLKDKKLSFPKKKYYTNSKGLKVEYWVMKPANFEAGKKYPVMLQIHGGPTAMWGPGEASMWHEYQFFCAHGYGVVYSNPRGSGGYGLNFLKANYRDWGTGPAEDVLAVLDGTLAEGWGDKTKTVTTGGSYAGYLTAWLAGHTKRFTAISSQRGVYDLTTFFGEGNAWRLVPMYFGGYPWEASVKPILARESPFTYVNQITTPYLMLHGETDLRTGIVQGEMMYKALKVLNRPVEYVQHPGGTHELSRSGNVRQRMDQMLRIYEFFSRYIKTE
jgi:dipeptidyl aminopeptidase/acylaminoacyl peptidase